MRIALLGLLVAAAIAGCGSDDERADPARRALTSPATATVEAEENVYTRGRYPPVYRPKPGEPVDGSRAVEQLGCLACHQIGERGNSGPGNNLSGIGSRKTAAELRAALLDPDAPMPSYRDLPRRWEDAVVAYLVSLRGEPCPDGSDCG